MSTTPRSGAERLRQFSFEEDYESNRDDLVNRFLVPGLDRATHYDRAVGYFRSSVFHLIGAAMSDFALRGGKIRIIASPSLTEQDYLVIKKARQTLDQAIDKSLANDIDELRQDELSHAGTRLLATLLEHEIMDFRIAFNPNAAGIFHSKIGVLRDGTDAVTWRDSVNETYMAWNGNEELLRPSCSWRDEKEKRYTQRDSDYFKRAWEGQLRDYEVCPLSKVSRELLQRYASSDPQEAIERVRVSYEREAESNPRGSRVRQSRLTLQEHQARSTSDWWKKKRGIVTYVTGGGKTFTALKIIEDWYEKTRNASVIVVVPSSLLVKQWRDEIKKWIPGVRMLEVGGDNSHPTWRARLGNQTRKAATKRRLVLAVINSASGEDFRMRAKVGDHTLMVVDEVHRIGAPKFLRLLELKAGGRLGLSATPDRFGDPKGTSAIFEYFGSPIPPPFTIRDAQNAEPPRLVQYHYYPNTVPLTAPEFAKYRSLSKKVGLLSARAQKSGKKTDQDKLGLALIERAKVLKGAKNKTSFALQEIEERYSPEDRWLVYCDGVSQLEEIQNELENRDYRTLVYHSAMDASKEATIQQFIDLGGIMLSINCLDEGIDIPAITHALILASSVNPRQHLQRRGRVLRTVPGKHRADIIDALVQPREEEGHVVFDQDLDRAYEFSEDAMNMKSVKRKLSTFERFSDPDPDIGPWSPFEEDDVLDEQRVDQ